VNFRKPVITFIIICSLVYSLIGGIIPVNAADSTPIVPYEEFTTGEQTIETETEVDSTETGSNEESPDDGFIDELPEADSSDDLIDAGIDDEPPDIITNEDNFYQASEDDFSSMDFSMAAFTFETLAIPEEIDEIERFVTRLYERVLNRKPDAGGLQYWSNQLRNRTGTGASVARGFFFSNEFLKRPGITNEKYLEILYMTLLNRSPDSSGLVYWSNQLHAGIPRENIFAGFVNSNEFDKLCKQYGITRGSYTPPSGGLARAFATRLYRLTLQREPDLGGLNYWHDALRSGKATGASVAQGFLFSTEMRNRSLSNEQFVEVLYNAILGRNSDASGKAYWVNQLRNGTSRESVFAGFVNSQEFGNLCSSYGIQRGTVVLPKQSYVMQGSSMVTQTWNYIARANFSGISDRPEHIAGIVGNLQSEAGTALCPFQLQVSNQVGLGLMQWSYGRRPSMENYMWNNGISQAQFHNEMMKHPGHICNNPRGIHPTDLLDRVLAVQIQFMFYELTSTSERLYMNYINYPANRSGAAGSRSYAELFCTLVLRPGMGSGDANNITDVGVVNALRLSPYAGGTGIVDRISYSGLATRRDRAEQAYLQFVGSR